MWAKTGSMPDADSLALKASASTCPISLEAQLLGFLVNIWNVVHPISFALSTDLSTEPEMETWNPILIGSYNHFPVLKGKRED